MTIKTERLVLRPWTEKDAPALFAIAKDPEVGPMGGWQPHKSEGQSKDIIRTVLKKKDNFAITLKDGTLIGCAGFLYGDDANDDLFDDEGELGYWLGRNYWGRGYATEAAQALLRYGFTKRDLSRIIATHYAENTASRHVLDKCGFMFEYEEDDVLQEMLGTTKTVCTLSILQEDWEEAHPKRK